jgi:indolepyruvate ferredoxin oxidoreductase beta subunit
MTTNRLVNIVVAGLGGQGVLKASDILAQAAVKSGLEVKKSEIKGMSQRGGSVSSDVRFGDCVLSPMVAPGEADFLLVLEPTQVEPHRYFLKPDGVLIAPEAVDAATLPSRKNLNVALLGVLSTRLALAESGWLEALQAAFSGDAFEQNRLAFMIGRHRKDGLKVT